MLPDYPIPVRNQEDLEYLNGNYSDLSLMLALHISEIAGNVVFCG